MQVRSIHTLFDLGLLSTAANHRVLVHQKLRGTEYEGLSEFKLRLPIVAKGRPIDSPTVDIDDVDDLGDMPEIGRPALSLADLKVIMAQPRLLPDGYEIRTLGVEDFAVEDPVSRAPRRATLSPDFYSEHFEHTDFWTMGSFIFPIEGRPTSEKFG